jgi:hypothetical protein
VRRGREAAALRGSVAGLEPLLAGGTGIDTGHANGPTSLMLAPAQGHDDLVAWLIERSARRVARNRPSRIAPSRAATWRGSRFCVVPPSVPAADRQLGSHSAGNNRPTTFVTIFPTRAQFRWIRRNCAASSHPQFSP